MFSLKEKRDLLAAIESAIDYEDSAIDAYMDERMDESGKFIRVPISGSKGIINNKLKIIKRWRKSAEVISGEVPR